MGGLLHQDELGGCDFLDVLEEAATLEKDVGVKLRSGEFFTAAVQDVVTEGGQNFVVFAGRNERMNVKDILAVTRAEPTKH